MSTLKNFESLMHRLMSNLELSDMQWFWSLDSITDTEATVSVEDIFNRTLSFSIQIIRGSGRSLDMLENLLVCKSPEDSILYQHMISEYISNERLIPTETAIRESFRAVVDYIYERY